MVETNNIKSLIFKWDPYIICFQETMMNLVVSKDIGYLWPHKEIKAMYQVTNELSGGILCCWDSSMFELCNFECMQKNLGNIESRILLQYFHSVWASFEY